LFESTVLWCQLNYWTKHFFCSYHHHSHLIWNVNILIGMTILSHSHFIYMAQTCPIIKSEKNSSIWKHVLYFYFSLLQCPHDDKLAIVVMCHLMDCNLDCLYLEYLLVIGRRRLIGCHDFEMDPPWCFQIKLINPTNLTYSQS